MCVCVACVSVRVCAYALVVGGVMQGRSPGGGGGVVGNGVVRETGSAAHKNKASGEGEFYGGSPRRSVLMCVACVCVCGGRGR